MYGLVITLTVLAVIAAVVFIVAVGNNVLSRRRQDRLSGLKDAGRYKQALRQIEEIAYNAKDFEPVLSDAVLREVRKVT